MLPTMLTVLALEKLGHVANNVNSTSVRVTITLRTMSTVLA